MFRIALTFNILLIVVLGGLGSIKGTTISAIIVTIMMEGLRFLDESIDIGSIHIEGVQGGMRMVVFSIILMIVVVVRKEGLIKES